VITSDYYRWNGVKRGARVGTLKAVCLFVTQPTSDSGTSLCTGVATLPAGTITVVGLVRGAKFRVPIVGGTGAYTGAKGYLAITNNLGGPNTNKSNDKFVITG
jgi:Allene oxide cyclase barrel like domain